MKHTFRFLLIALYPCLVSLSQPCKGITINNEASAVQVLTELSPEAKDPVSRNCITRALDLASELRSQKAIPELIRYISFQRDRTPEEAKGTFLHPPFEGYDHPAISAIARIGEAGRHAALQLIESPNATATDAQNAAHAIVLSFLHEPERDPGKAIIYLRQAKTAVGAKTQQKLELAISFILTTEACTRFRSKCDQANSEKTGGRPKPEQP